MKRYGFSIMEVVVSISLFLISLIPLMRYTVENTSLNRRFLQIEKKYKNFIALEKQLRSVEQSILLDNIGVREYLSQEFGKDRLTGGVYLPYPLKDNSKIKIEIKKINFKFQVDSYHYLCLKIMYTDNNKSISSENYIDFD